MTPEVTRAPSILVAPPAPPPEEPDNFYFYGYRDVCRTLPDGTSVWEQVPLTLADVLHPQEGDHITESNFQKRESSYLLAQFGAELHRLQNGAVLSDCLVNWNVPGQGNTAPDVAVFTNLNRPLEYETGLFDVADYGARPLFVVEIVSPHTRSTDVVDKPPEYHAAGVPLYILVDRVRRRGPRQILAYRRTPQGYDLLPLDADGRFALPGLALKLGLRDNRVYCYDAVTGEERPDPDQAQRERLRERAARLAAEQAQRTAEQGQQTAEEARRTAEQAQRTAEERAQADALARQNLEQRVRELEEELRRSRGDAAP